MNIICYGIPFVFGYNANGSLIKGCEDSRRPLAFVGITTISNILLDILFVGYLHMETGGAAYATILSQALSFFLAVFYMNFKKYPFHFHVHDLRLNKNILKLILKVGLPAAIQMIVVNVSYLLVTGMLNHYGTAVIAASRIGLKVNTFAGMPCWAIGQTATMMVGKSMGDGNIDRVKSITLLGLRLNIVITIVMMANVQLFAREIMMLFDPGHTEIIATGIFYLRICCCINSIIYAIMYSFDSFAIGIDNANIAMIMLFWMQLCFV